MKLPWIQGARQIDPIRPVSTKAQELQAAKRSYEVFHARLADVEEMISEKAGGEGLA